MELLISYTKPSSRIGQRTPRESPVLCLRLWTPVGPGVLPLLWPQIRHRKDLRTDDATASKKNLGTEVGSPLRQRPPHRPPVPPKSRLGKGTTSQSLGWTPVPEPLPRPPRRTRLYEILSSWNPRIPHIGSGCPPDTGPNESGFECSSNPTQNWKWLESVLTTTGTWDRGRVGTTETGVSERDYYFTRFHTLHDLIGYSPGTIRNHRRPMTHGPGPGPRNVKGRGQGCR